MSINKTNDKLSKAVDAEVLIHGAEHPAVARAHSNYGEWLLNEGDVGHARFQLEAALRVLKACIGPGNVTEDMIDAHYRVGRAIAAESRVTGSSAASKSHMLKTLAMREDYDAQAAMERLATGSASVVDLPTLSSGMDSTLIYADLAETERAAGNYKEACVLYMKSLKLRRAKFGDVSAPVAQVLSKYADVLRLSLKYGQSKFASEEALAIYMHLFGPKHVQVTEAMNSLGQVQRLLGNLQESEALLLEALQIRREMHGDYHVNTASSLNNLAEVCREKEDFFQAINYHNASIEAFTKAVGVDHPGTVNARGNLGVTLRRQAKQSSDLGQSLVREAVDYLKSQQYDPEHPWMAKFDTENAMAQAEHLASEGKHEEALQLYEALINKKHIIAQLNSTAGGAAGDRDSSSPTKRASQDVVLLTEGKVQALMKRAMFLTEKGQFREAEKVYSNLVAASTKILGMESLVIYRAMIAHAVILIRLAQYTAATEILQAALQSRIDLRGPDDVEVAEASQALAEVYRLCANFDAASALYVHCMEVLGDALRKEPFSMEKTSKAYPLNELFVRVTLGLAKLQAVKGVFPKARALLSQGKETAAKTLGEEHSLYLDLLTLEGSIHFDCGNIDNAVELHKHCLGQRMATRSTKVYSSLHHLARISLFLCDFTQAASYLDESISLFEASMESGESRPASPRNSAETAGFDQFNAPHPTLLRLNHTKSLLLLAIGSFDEAQKLMESTVVSRRICLGARHHCFADSLVALGQLGHARGLPGNVFEGLELALDIYRELFVYDMQKDISACRFQLAVNAMLGGRYDSAITLLTEIKEQRAEFYNKMGVQHHVDIAQASAALARAMAIHGETLELAESLAVAAGSSYCLALGLPTQFEQSPAFGSMRFAQLYLAEALESLAAVSTARGRYKDARAHLSHAVAIRSNIQSITHPAVQQCYLQAVENICYPGYFEAAKPLSAHYCDFVLATFSDKSMHAVSANLLQARLVLYSAAAYAPMSDERQDAAIAAEPFFSQALFTIRDTLGEDNVLYASTSAELASCLQAQSKAKFLVAEQLLKQANESLLRLCSSVLHLRVLDVTVRRCQLLISMRQEEDALPLLVNQVIPTYTEVLGAEHPSTMFAKALQGVCMNDKKRGSGLENIRTALLLWEDYEQLPLVADHPFLTAVGGYENAAKSRTSKVVGLDQPALVSWCLPTETGDELTEEQRRVAVLNGETIKKRYLFQADTQLPDADAVVLFDAESWGTVGGRRRPKGAKKGPQTLGVALFKPLLEQTPPYAIGSGDNAITAIDILRGAVATSQEAIYGHALTLTVADKAREAGASVQRVRGAHGKLAQLAAEAAAKDAAVVAKEVEAEETDVRAKLNDLRKTLEEEETRLAEVRLQKMTEETETEELRTLRELEEEEVRQLSKQKKVEELAILTLVTQKETETAEAKALEEARKKHEEDLARVTDELMAKMEEVAQAEIELKKLKSLHAVVQATPLRGEGDVGGGDDASTVGEGQSVASADIPRAVAVVLQQPEDSGGTATQTSLSVSVGGPGDAGKTELAQSSSTDMAITTATATATGSSGGKALTGKELKRQQALDAASFMFSRAKDMDRDGQYAKARPLFEEVVAIREKQLKLQPPHLEALVALAENVIACNDFHAAWPLLTAALERHQQDTHNKSAAEAAEADADEEGMALKTAGVTMGSIEIAEILQLQAWNLYCVGKYLQAAPKMSEAVKMFIAVVGDGHHLTGRCLAKQAMVLLSLARLDEAKATADRSFAILNKAFGTKDAATAIAMMARARVLVAMGKSRDAKPLVEQSISMRKRLCGERNPLVAESFRLMGTILMQQSRLSEAGRWFLQAREVLLDTITEHTLPVADVDFERAKLLRINGKVFAAAALFEKVAECRRKWYPLVLSAEEIEANTPKPKTEEELDAEADLELRTGKKVEPFKPKPPITHSSIQDCIEAQAELALQLGQFTQADGLLREAGKLRKEYCTEEASTDGTVCHPDLAANFFLKAESLRLRGLFDEARPIHQLAFELRSKALGKDHPATVMSTVAMANLLCNTGQLEEAEQAYRKVLKKMKDVLSDDHFAYADSQSAYSDCLRRLGRLEKARKLLDESTAARRMLFEDANPDHLALIEAANNAGLLAMDELRAPPPTVDAGESITSVDAAGAAAPGSLEGKRDDYDAEEAIALAKLKEQSSQQARLSQSQEDDESILSPLPPPDQIAEDPLDADARTAKLLEEGEAVAEGQIATEEPPETFSRDENGVPLFNNSVYLQAIELFETSLRILAAKYTPLPVPGDASAQKPHPWAINIQGNIGIVLKLQFEEKLRFLYGLRKEDRKLFKRNERRLERMAAAALKSAVAAEESASTFTEAAAAGDASEPKPAATAKDVTAEEDEAEEDEDEKKKGEDAVVPGTEAIEGAIAALRARGIEPTHPWIVKFLSYRVVLEKPPDEMGIAKELLAEAALLSYRGFFMAADLKLDEALSLQIEYIGIVPALTNLEVAATVQAKAESALSQCRFDAAKKMFMQAFFMFCKMESPESPGACRALFGVAELLRCRGLSEDARVVHEKVLGYRMKQFGKLSIETATSLNALALCLNDLGLCAEAFEAANSALSTCLRVERPAVGQDGYLYTASARLVLGRVLLSRGDIVSASAQIKAAHELHVSALGADHVWSADYLQCVAEVRLLQGKMLDARKLVGQAMKIRLKTLGKLKYNSFKLKAQAQAFLDQSPEGDSINDAEDNIKGLKLPSGLAPPSAADAFGGRAASLDYDLASLIASSVDSIAGSVGGGGSVASSKLSVKEEVKRGYSFRGVPVSSHAALADTLQLRGDICLGLGDLLEAREMVEGCYAVRKDLFGKRAVPTSKCFLQLGRLVSYLGVPKEAATLATIAYHLRLQLLGGSHPALAEAQLSVAAAKLQLDRIDECSTFVLDAKRVCKDTVGTCHPLFAAALALEAELQYKRGEYASASELAEKALGLFKATYKEVHPTVASVLLLEGKVSLALGILDVAQVKLEQAASQRGVFYGDDNVAVVEVRHWTAMLMREQGKCLEAKPLIEQVLTSRRDRLGKYHPDTIFTLALLAFNMLELGKFATAIPVLDRAAQLLRRALGDDSLVASWATFGLAEARRMEGNLSSSYELHSRVSLARRRVLVSETHPVVLQSNHALARLAMDHGHYEEATKLLDNVLAQRRMSLGQMHVDVASTLHDLGEVLRLRGKLAEARSMHERALKMRRTVLDVDHPDIVDSQQALAQITAAFGKLEQAAAVLDRCLSNYRLKRGARHPSVSKALYLLGSLQTALGNFEAGKAHIIDSLMLRKATFSSLNHPDVAESIAGLAENLRVTGCLIDTGSSVANSTKVLLTTLNAGLDAPLGSNVPPLHGSPSSANKSPSAKTSPAKSGLGTTSLVDGTAFGTTDDGSVVSGVSGEPFGFDGGGSQLGGIPGLSRSLVRDDKSVDVDSVGMSVIEERFGFVSVAEFLDDGEHTLVETGGTSGSKSRSKKAQTPTAVASPVRGGGSVGGDSHASSSKLQAGGGGFDEEEERHCLPLYERCLDMCLKTFGLDHPRTWAIQHGIALTLMQLGNFALAHDLFLHVVGARKGHLGYDHLDTIESLAGLADALRLMSRLYPEQTPEAAEKRKNPNVEKAMGPSLIEHLASILGQPDGLKKQWPPEASSALVLLEKGKTTTETMHPLLLPPKQRLLSRDRYLGGFQGYAYPTPKKIKRAVRENALCRPDKTFYNDAKWVWDVATASLKRVVGEVSDHPMAASLVYGRAELMRARRRIDLAIPLFEEALASRRRIFRANHPAVSDCLLGLAEIFRSENKFSRSQPLLEKVLEIRQSCFASVGGVHPGIGEVQCYLAMLHFSMGQYLVSEPLYQESLQLRERTLGETNIATAQTLNNYGGLLHALGRCDEALPMYRRVLDIKIATFGSDHPDTASAKNNLALLLKAMGRLEEARGFYEGALKSQQEVFGLMHTDVASTLNNLAALEVACGNISQAKANYRQSLEIKRKVLGMEHPSVASTLNNLAGLCISCGELDDARDMYDESLRLRRAAFGDDHPTVAESLNNIGLLLFSDAQYSAAMPLFERSIVIKTASYGDSHPNTASSMHNLAIVLHRLRRYAEAEAMYTRALEIRSERLGTEHSETRATYSAMQAMEADRARAPRSAEARQVLALEKLGKAIEPQSEERRQLVAKISATVAGLEAEEKAE